MITRDELLQERLNFAVIDSAGLNATMTKLRDARPSVGTAQEKLMRDIEAALDTARYWADKMLKDYGSPR